MSIKDGSDRRTQIAASAETLIHQSANDGDRRSAQLVTATYVYGAKDLEPEEREPVLIEPLEVLGLMRRFA